jgi:hypothetical protein
MTNTSTAPETTTVVVPVPFQVTYERVQYIHMKDIDFNVTVDGSYLGIVGHYPGETVWTATVAGGGTLSETFPTRSRATKALILANRLFHLNGCQPYAG